MLKIFCVKIFKSQLDLLDNLVLDDLYFSRCEISRIASRNLLLDFEKGRGLNYSKSSFDDRNSFIDSFEPFSLKFPFILLKAIDQVVIHHKHIFGSRSEFIRISIDKFFQDQNFLHDLILKFNSLSINQSKGHSKVLV